MVEFGGLEIFSNNTISAATELLKDVGRHPATVSLEPLAVLTRDGYQEFVISFNFDAGYDINYANKSGSIRIETPFMNKILRPFIEEKTSKLKEGESKYGLEQDILKELIHKDINVYAEYFPGTSSSSSRIFSYAISETDDTPWGHRVLFTTSKESTKSLFRNFKKMTTELSDEVRELLIIPAKISRTPIYRRDVILSGFQIDFAYQDYSQRSINDRRREWHGHSVINYLHMGRFMKLLEVSNVRGLAGNMIAVYLVHNPAEGRNIVCGVGSYD